jgi:CSLREA domain-containing protein
MRRLTSTLAALALLLPALEPRGAAHAAEIVVTTTDDEFDTTGGCSLREALRAANFNFRVEPCGSGSETETDTIVLADGATYALTRAGTIDFLTGDLDVRDNQAAADLVVEVAGGGKATIEQTANDRVLQVHAGANVEVHGVTFKRGRSLPAQGPFGSEPLGDGGGIANAGGLTLVGCAVLENAVERKGGGIYNGPAGARLTLIDTEVGRNQAASPEPTAGVRGGGIFNEAGSSLTVEGGRIFQNTANEGGGIYNDEDAEATLLNGVEVGSPSSFSANSAALQGGGIYNDSRGVLTIIESRIASNTGNLDGGGIVNEGELALVSSLVENNTATGRGGGIFNLRGTLFANGGRISGNLAGRKGGGVFNGAFATIEGGAAIDSNRAGEEGGGVYSAGILTIDASSLAFNSAVVAGGGLYREPTDDPPAVVTRSVFRLNRANDGGAVYVRGSSVPSFAASGSCFLRNTTLALSGSTTAEKAATESWWGDASGPGGAGPGSGDGVQEGVDFSGFLASAPPGCGADLVDNGDMTRSRDGADHLIPVAWRVNANVTPPADGHVCGAERDCVLRLTGDGRSKKLVQKIARRGRAGDTFTFSARSRASQVPEAGAYLAMVKVKYTDGSSEVVRLRFAPGTHTEEVLARTFTARAPYRLLKVMIQLDKQSGTALFDDVSLIRE